MKIPWLKRWFSRDKPAAKPWLLWEYAPDWADWAAQDTTGQWYWFENKPRMDQSGQWWPVKGKVRPAGLITGTHLPPLSLIVRSR